MSADEQAELRTFTHKEIVAAFGKRNGWFRENAPWILTVLTISVTGLVWLVSLQRDVKHHLAAPFHDGMAETNTRLAEIQLELRYLHKQVDVINAQIEALEKKIIP